MSTLVRDTNGVLHQVAGKSVVDNVLSNTSKNPISNKAVTLALQNKVEIATRNLVNYYLKAETYTKEEVNALVGAISSMTIEVVNTLPTTDISPTTIYWVGPDSETGLYDQYIYSNDKWIKTGDTSLDLSGYVLKTTFEVAIADFFTKDEIAALFNDYYNKSDLNLLLDEKQDVLTFDNIPISGSENPVKSGGVYSALGTKQDSLEYDTSPTKNSEKMVKSGGIYTALESKQDSLTFDNVPTENSANVVKSGGVYSAVDDVYKVISRNGAKNLNIYPYHETTETKNGITFTDNGDGSITANGTSTDVAQFFCHLRTNSVTEKNNLIVPNGTYIVSGCPSDIDGAAVIVANITENGVSVNKGMDRGNGDTFTVEGDDYYDDQVELGVLIYVYSGKTLDNVTFYPMIRLASDTDSTWQPYIPTNEELSERITDVYKVMGQNSAKNFIPFDLDRIKVNNTTGTWNDNVYSLNGIDFTFNSDGTIDASGTATAAASVHYYDPVGLPPFGGNRILRLTGCPSGGSLTTYKVMGYRVNAVDGSTGTAEDFGDGINLRWLNDGSGTKAFISFSVYTGAGTIDLTFKPMLCLATDTDNTFVPYAMTNQQLTKEVNDIVNVYGSKNVLDLTSRLKKNFPSNSIVTNFSDDGIVLNGTISSSGHIRICPAEDDNSFVLPQGTYVLSHKDGRTPSGTGITLRKNGAALTINNNLSTPYEFEANGTDYFTVLIHVNATTFDNAVVCPMICLKSFYELDASFEPYAKTNQQLTKDTTGLLDNLEVNGAVNVLPNTAVTPTQPINGITFTVNDDGTITIDGTASATAKFDIYHENAEKWLKQNTAYKATVDNSVFGGLATQDCFVQLFREGSPYPRIATFNGSAFIVSDSYFNVPQKLGVQIVISKGVTVTNQTIKPMITVAPYNGEFVPYAMSNKKLTENATKLITLPTSVSIFDVLADASLYPVNNTYWKRAQGITNGSDTISSLLSISNDAIVRIDVYNIWYIDIEINDAIHGKILTACGNKNSTTLKFIQIDTSTSPYISQVTLSKATT